MTTHRPVTIAGLPDDVTPETELLGLGKEPRHKRSITSLADEALATGQSPLGPRDEEIPGEDNVLRAGDPDVDPLSTEFSGEDAPGGSNSSPDSNGVDAIGRLFGVSESDTHGLVLGDDLIDRRDRDRWENDPDSKDK